MIRKTTILKRKSKGLFLSIFLLLLIFLGTFGICFGVWFFFQNHTQLRSPLAKVALEGHSGVLTRLQNFCVIYHLNCTNIIINNNNTALITIDNNEKVFLSLQKDIAVQFASLQLTISHLTIEGRRFSRLDLRFDKPVISY